MRKTYNGRIFGRKDGLWRGVRTGMGPLSQLRGYVPVAANVDFEEFTLRTRDGSARLNKLSDPLLHVQMTGSAKAAAIGTMLYIGKPDELFLNGDPFARINGNQYNATAAAQIAGIEAKDLDRWVNQET